MRRACECSISGVFAGTSLMTRRIAARGSKLQVQFVEERLVRFELDGAESRRKVGGTKRLQFVNEGGLGLFGAGGDQSQWDAGRAPAVLADASG